jgi:hypothetical protein
MSAATLRPALAGGPTLASYPMRVLAVVAWAAVALALAPWATDAFVWWSGSGLALVALWPFARAWRHGLDPGDAMWYFLLYFVLAILLRGIGLLTFVDSTYVCNLGDARSLSFRQLVGWVFFYSTLGLTALNAAYHAPYARRWVEGYLERRTLLSAPWRESRIVPVGLGLLAIGGIGLLLRMQSLGGFASAADDPIGAGTEKAVGYFWTIALTEFAVVGYHVLVVGAMLRGDRRLPWIWLGLGLLLSLPIFLISGSKNALIRVFFPPVLFWHFLRKPLRLGHVLGFFVGFALLFPLFYAYKAVGIAGLDDAGQYIETLDAPLLVAYNRSYDADSFMRVLHATGQGLVPLQWGRSLDELFTFFIPRALWAAKPESFGLKFPRLYMPDVYLGPMTYVSPSLPGVFFLNFHVVGVLGGFLLLGWGMRAAVTLARRGGAGAVLLYGYFFLDVVQSVEGSIHANIVFFLGSAVPALIALILLRGQCAPGAPSRGAA